MEGSGHTSNVRDHNIRNISFFKFIFLSKVRLNITANVKSAATPESVIKEPEVKVEVILEKVNDQKDENDENKVEIEGN